MNPYNETFSNQFYIRIFSSLSGIQDQLFLFLKTFLRESVSRCLIGCNFFFLCYITLEWTHSSFTFFLRGNSRITSLTSKTVQTKMKLSFLRIIEWNDVNTWGSFCWLFSNFHFTFPILLFLYNEAIRIRHRRMTPDPYSSWNYINLYSKKESRVQILLKIWKIWKGEECYLSRYLHSIFISSRCTTRYTSNREIVLGSQAKWSLQPTKYTPVKEICDCSAEQCHWEP